MTAYDDGLSVATIYAAEQNVATAVRAGGAVQFLGGSTLDLDRCRIRTYTPAQLPLLRGMMAGLYARHRSCDREQPPTLRASSRAYRRAWYDSGKHEIVLPAAQWGWTDLVLCHETAHACCCTGHDQRSAHGLVWRRTYAALVADVIGQEAALLLQGALDL